MKKKANQLEQEIHITENNNQSTFCIIHNQLYHNYVVFDSKIVM